jgi:hypothetical protein
MRLLRDFDVWGEKLRDRRETVSLYDSKATLATSDQLLSFSVFLVSEERE